ncbi:MAG TPA: MBL fold metallo-hydrolase [Gammaproteobacteria bacterium]|nr:MBL fold metallo-hydrolase [Gammaproteobacteria bacterium]
MTSQRTKNMLTWLLGLLLACTGLAAHADGSHGKPAVDRVKGPLSVMVLGSSGPMAQPSGRASAGYLVFTDGKPRVLMDLGGGTFQRIAQSGANIGNVNIILLSHLHIDHASELPAVVKTMYFHARFRHEFRTAPINIWGPGTDNPMFPSTTQLVNGLIGPKGVFRYLGSFVDHGLGHFAYTTHDLSPDYHHATEQTVYDKNGLVIKAIAVDHLEAPAVAYRIEYKGRSIVYSGDTNSSTNDMVTLARGADLLIYDTSIMDNAPPPQSLFFQRHTTPTRLGQVAAMANPRELVLSHLTPVSLPNIPKIKKIIRNQGYTGQISEAHDLKVYNVGLRDDGSN